MYAAPEPIEAERLAHGNTRLGFKNLQQGQGLGFRV